MKVLHLITGLNQGGAERQLANLVSVDACSTAVFSILSPGDGAAEIHAAGVPVYSGYARRPLSLGWIRSLQRAISTYQPDVVMGWMYHGNLAASFSRALGHRGPILWNVRHSVYDLALEKKATRWAIRAGAHLSRSPTRIIYNSFTSADQHESLGFTPRGRVVLPNGFDLDRFRPDEARREECRSNMGIGPAEILIGVVGRAHPMKNHVGWVEAFRKVLERGYPIRGLIMGTGVNTKNSPLHDAIREAGLESAIICLGPSKNPEQIYPGLDLLVMPSRWGEGFPNAVGEAMASGVPAVVAPVGDAPSVTADTGFVCQSADSNDLAAGVEVALKYGQKGLSQLGCRARRRIEENYSLPSVASSYNRLFAEILNE